MPSGYSIHIGVNFVDPDHYEGWSRHLNSAVRDAIDLEMIAKSKNFRTNLLLTTNATRDRVVAAIRDCSNFLSSGDIFLITFSGHGGQIPNLNGVELNGKHASWCLYDGQLTEDELEIFWSLFKEDVRILIISDSCHSGSLAKFTRKMLTNILIILQRIYRKK
jgi:metacaspase-1